MAELIPIANLRGPQGNKGDKGDTGIGWNTPNIGDIHLNDLVTPGTHKQPFTGLVTKSKGYPREGDPGHVQVIPYSSTDSKGVTQEWTTYTNTSSSIATWGRYIRTCRNGVWSPWGHMPTQRVDNTSGRAIYTWDDSANREQLIYGDTGKRILTTLVNPIFGVTVAKIRRVTNEVEIQLQMNKPNGAGSGLIAVLPEQLPTGFRNQHTVQTAAFINSNPTLANLAFSGGPLSVSGFPETATTLYLMMKYTTTDAWPATLPGTPDTQLP